MSYYLFISSFRFGRDNFIFNVFMFTVIVVRLRYKRIIATSRAIILFYGVARILCSFKRQLKNAYIGKYQPVNACFCFFCNLYPPPARKIILINRTANITYALISSRSPSINSSPNIKSLIVFIFGMNRKNGTLFIFTVRFLGAT